MSAVAVGASQTPDAATTQAAGPAAPVDPVPSGAGPVAKAVETSVTEAKPEPENVSGSAVEVNEKAEAPPDTAGKQSELSPAKEKDAIAGEKVERDDAGGSEVPAQAATTTQGTKLRAKSPRDFIANLNRSTLTKWRPGKKTAESPSTVAVLVSGSGIASAQQTAANDAGPLVEKPKRRSTFKRKSAPTDNGTEEAKDEDQEKDLAKNEDKEKAKPDEKRKPGELKMLWPATDEEATWCTVDIVAVHDIDENVDNAWTYPLERAATAALAAMGNADKKGGDGAKGGFDRSRSRKRRGSLKQKDLEALNKASKEKSAARKSVVDWNIKVGEGPPVDPATPPPAPAEATDNGEGPSQVIDGGVGDGIVGWAADVDKADELETPGPATGGVAALGDRDGLEYEDPDAIGPFMTPAVAAPADVGTKGKEKELSEALVSVQEVLPDDNAGVAPGKVTDKGSSKGDNASQSQSVDGKPQKEASRKGNWLSDRTMLSGGIGRARILAFSYKPPALPTGRGAAARAADATNYATYLDNMVDDFIAGLVERRADERYAKVPLVLIGSGFGCLGVEKLLGTLSRRAEEDSKGPASVILGMLAGVVFFEAPNPVVREGEQEKDGKQKAEKKEAAEQKADRKEGIEKKETGQKTDKKEAALEGDGKRKAETDQVKEKSKPGKEPDEKNETEQKKEGEQKEAGQKKEAEKKKDNEKAASKALRGSFPPYASSKSRWFGVLLKQRLVDSSKIWEEFHEVVEAHDVPVIWFFQPIPDKRADFSVPGVKFVPLQTPDVKAGTQWHRFRGPSDDNFRTLVGEVRGCLLRKVAIDKELYDLLESFLQEGYHEDLKAVDHQGKCPLHHAAEKANEWAVARILQDNPATVSIKDATDGRAVMHVVVMMATRLAPTDEEAARAPFRNMITSILEAFSSGISMTVEQLKDHSNKSAWDYARSPRHRWIAKVRDEHQKLLPGATVTRAEELAEPKAPAKSSLQYAVCWLVDANLVQFYINNDEREDYLDLRPRRIYEVIYDRKSGPLKTFQSNERPKGGVKATCRWIHIPANNERWLKDLFLRLRLIDHSLVPARRHRGSKPYDQYIIPGAHSYKQVFVPKPAKSEGMTAQSVAGDSFSGVSFSNPFQGSRPGRLYSRSYSSSIASDDGGIKRSAIALFIPILGFEQHQYRKELSAAIKREDESLGFDGHLLIRAYSKPRELHLRRTLDQFTYHMLGDTEERDNDQVIFRWARKMHKQDARTGNKPPPNKDDDQDGYPILMVDQLWIWILEGEESSKDTVITSFPDTGEPSEFFNLKTLLMKELRGNNDRPLIHSAMDLANLIIKSSVDFMKRKGPLTHSLQESFQSSISDVAEKQATLFKEFKKHVMDLNKLSVDRPNQKTRSNLTNKLFQLTHESHLLTIIMDIQDELKSIRDVLVKQRDALDRFVHLADEYENRKRGDRGSSGKHGNYSDKNTTDDEADRGATGDDQQAQEDDAESLEKTMKAPPPSTPPLGSPTVTRSPGLGGMAGNKNSGRRGGKTVHFEVGSHQKKRPNLARENLDLVKANIDAVDEMSRYATRVHKELHDLLDLKQKQANAWEARFAREGSEQTQRQGNITMVFTLVTIVFLPLSFMSSVFAISVADYPRNAESGEVAWPIREMMSLLFGISFAIIIPLCILAFSVNYISAYAAELKNRLWPREPSHDDGDGDSDSLIERSLDSDSNWSKGRASSAASVSARVYLGVRRRVLGIPTPFKKLVRYGRSEHGSSAQESSSDAALSDSVVSVEESFAPLFGYFEFHTKIPWVREAWRYRYYTGSAFGTMAGTSNGTSNGRSGGGSSSDESESSSDRWSDLLVIDYPLHYALHGLKNLVRRFLVDPVRTCLGLMWIWMTCRPHRGTSVTTGSLSTLPSTELGSVEVRERIGHTRSRWAVVREAKSSSSDGWSDSV